LPIANRLAMGERGRDNIVAKRARRLRMRQSVFHVRRTTETLQRAALRSVIASAGSHAALIPSCSGLQTPAAFAETSVCMIAARSVVPLRHDPVEPRARFKRAVRSLGEPLDVRPPRRPVRPSSSDTSKHPPRSAPRSSSSSLAGGRGRDRRRGRSSRAFPSERPARTGPNRDQQSAQIQM
jgi:hypothetical protein